MICVYVILQCSRCTEGSKETSVRSEELGHGYAGLDGMLAI